MTVDFAITFNGSIKAKDDIRRRKKHFNDTNYLKAISSFVCSVEEEILFLFTKICVGRIIDM